MAKNIKGYAGPYFVDGGYYIHQHVTNIGKAGNGSGGINLNYQQQKKNALNASKNYYKNLFKSNLSADSITLLNEVFDRDDLMLELNKQMKNALQESINFNAIQKGIQIQRQAFDSNIIKNLLNNKMNQIKEFDKLLTSFAECCALLRSPEGDKLALLLIKVKGRTNQTVKEKSAFLQQALNTFLAENNTKTFEGQQVDEIAKRMNAIANALSTQSTGSGKELTKDGLNKMVDAVFNTGFGEAFAGMLQNTARINIDNAIASMTGGKTSQVQVTNAFGDLVGFKDTSSAGKVDTKLSNVKITIDAKNDLQGGIINIDLGISNKQYRTQHFPGLDSQTNKQSFGGGSGGSLREALDSLFGFGTLYEKYLSYNILAHSDKPSIAGVSAELNDLLLTRQLLRIFSTRGGSSDFAQFMLVNGQIVSIWELILESENFLGALSSQAESMNQAITLSISDRPSIYKAAKILNSYKRVHAVNSAINKAKITAHIHLNKLTAAL